MTRAVFLGSPPASVPTLAAAMELLDVIGVVTQPDKPQKRSSDPVPTAVKTAAREWGVPVLQPSGADLAGVIAGMRPDVGVIVAYGRILKPDVLAIPPAGFVNVHFSLLPRWRGAAPVQAAIAAGDEQTGVSLMKLDEGLDTGPVMATSTTKISPADTGGTLTARLASIGARLFGECVHGYLGGELDTNPQDDAAATHAPRLVTADARLDPSRTAEALDRAVRAFSPRPGAWVDTAEGRLKIHVAHGTAAPSPPGEITVEEGLVRLGTSEGSLVLDVVQPAGRQAMDARAWMNGRRNEPVQIT